MAKRGRKPTPQNILKLRGSWRGDIKKDENNLSSKAPIMPSWLSSEAKKEWRKTIRILKAQGTLIEMDGPYILTYCQAYVDYKEISEEIRKMNIEGRKDSEGKFLTKTENGNIIQSPIIGIRNAAWKRLCDATKNLALPPSGRSHIQQPEIKTKKEKKKDRFFKKPS